MKDVAALSRIKRLLSPRRNELAAGADDAHGRRGTGSSWLSDDPQTLRDCFNQPSSTDPSPCWKVFGRRWRGLAKSYRVICLLRRTTSGRGGGEGEEEGEETKDRGL